MSKISHLPKSVPPKEIPFSLKIKGSNTKFQYTGDFVVKVPNLREMTQIGVELGRLNNGVPLELLDRSTANMHNAIAFLKVALIKGPNWFMNQANDKDEEGMEYGLDTIDVNVPMEIFRKADKCLTEWYKALDGQPKDDSEIPKV